MNEFENNVQSKRNDAIDAGMGFVVSFVFFAAIFIIAAVNTAEAGTIEIVFKKDGYTVSTVK